MKRFILNVFDHLANVTDRGLRRISVNGIQGTVNLLSGNDILNTRFRDALFIVAHKAHLKYLSIQEIRFYQQNVYLFCTLGPYLESSILLFFPYVRRVDGRQLDECQQQDEYHNKFMKWKVLKLPKINRK